MKAIIFDLDGVIVHTDKFHYKAWKAVADKCGIDFDETVNNRLRGVSRMESLEIIMEKSPIKYSSTQKNEIAENKNTIYRELLLLMTPDDMSSEVKNTLQTLKERGYKLAIGSSSKNAPLILSKIGMDAFFDAISDGNNISKSKPDPEVFLKAAKFLGVEPKECYVVEDAVAGIEAAKAGGMCAIAIGDAVKCPQSDITLNTFGDLLTSVV